MMTSILLALLATSPAGLNVEKASVAPERPPITADSRPMVAATPSAPAYSAPPSNSVWEGRDFAKTWGMHRIAVIQACDGDVQGAKHTLSQIGDYGEKTPADVTGVWFCNGRIIYDHPPGQSLVSWRAAYSAGDCRTAAVVPAKAPPGLPVNYLAPDSRRGAVVEFVDDQDSRGTRVTSRRYADGSLVIETPRSGDER